MGESILIKDTSVNILGTEYKIKVLSKEMDPLLNKCDGYCDKTVKEIVLSTKDDYCEIKDYERYQRGVLRHEIIHAFMFESGLAENWEHKTEYGHDETTVDWIALQYPKISEAFKSLGIEN